MFPSVLHGKFLLVPASLGNRTLPKRGLQEQTVSCKIEPQSQEKVISSEGVLIHFRHFFFVFVNVST